MKKRAVKNISKAKYLLIILSIFLVLIINGCAAKTLESCKGEECIDVCKEDTDLCKSFCLTNKEKCPDAVKEWYEKLTGAPIDLPEIKEEASSEEEDSREYTSEAYQQACAAANFPPDCSMIPFPEGQEICKKCQGTGYKTTTTSTDKFITANPIDLSQINRISKFRSCVGHDYSGLNINGEKETLRSMKHYIEPMSSLLREGKVKIFAPFDGKISELTPSTPGNYIFISADASPNWQFIFFHAVPASGINTGTSVKAGQHIGYASKDNQVNFDYALKKFGREGQIFDSLFLHMTDAVLKEYESSGITTKNIIIAKEIRDSSPCKTTGIRNGDATFPAEGEPDDWIKLK